MCGRYYYADNDRLIRELMEDEMSSFSAKDIHPSDVAPIITGRDAELALEKMRWGFINSQTKQLLINARAESALEKRTFSESVLRRRCIIPAAHFYEWDKEKTKHTFSLEADSTLFMAGFFNRFQNEDRFIILTTGANDSMSPVHDRMPMILAENEIDDWIHRDDLVRDFLAKESPLLVRSAEYQQMSLWFD